MITLLLLLCCGNTWAQDMLWRKVDPDNLVFVELLDGRFVMELNPRFAPKTVEQFRQLVLQRFYDGLSFYRVIDGFVAQGGDGSDLGALSEIPEIEAEFEIDWVEKSDDVPETPFTLVQKPDLFADETGFIDAFPVARDRKKNQLWLSHCPGMVAMARNDDIHSSRTDFYIVIGQAPRYLDRNMNVFARVIDGMEVVQRIKRGPADANGVISVDTDRSRIRTMRLASELPEDERLIALVMDSESRQFERMLDDRRNRKQKFFHNKPPQVLDICQIPNAGQITK
ncbi:MAG TPA: peptidylprolyl isomerase [Xanthomonadales bacterium]|nr:peptidylprolyl isomerase [Xanthomonadales bacterium]